MNHYLHRMAPVVALTLLAACQAQDKLGPSLPTAPTDLSRYAYYLQIDLEQGTIAVTPPARPSPGTGTTAGLRPAFSLMGSDIIALTTSNFTRSAVGAVVPNKRTITFDLAITNRLSVSDLVTPTFPQPPAGIQGLIAFPYTVAPAGTQGGKAVPDNNWDGDGSPGSGAPTNLFNDFATCPTGAQSDCYRWELFPAPLAPGATTAPRKVGFTVGAGVTSVGVYLVVAADLLDHPPPPPPPGRGGLIGTVTSSLGGPIPGAVITLTPGGTTTTTDGLGVYASASLPPGAVTVSVSGLPANCTAPAPAGTTVASGTIARVDFVAPCVAPTGTLYGIVQIQEVLPGGGTVLRPHKSNDVEFAGIRVLTDDNGFFQISGVPTGSYPVGSSNFPSIQNCDATPPITLTTGGGPATAPTITLVCQVNVGVRVTDTHAGTPLAGVDATVTGGGRVFAGTTDPTGRFWALQVQSGSYDILVTPPTGCTVTGPPNPVQTYTNGSVIFDYAISCGPAFSATITGGVTGQPFVDLPDGSTEQAFGGVQVSAPSGLTTVIGTADAVGHYSLAALTPGTYTLQLLSPPPGSWGLLLQCFATGPVQVTVPAGGGTVTAPDLSAYCTRGGVRGTVQFDQPFQGGRVVALDPLATAPTDPGAVLSYMDISAGVMASYYAVTVPDQVATDIRVEAASTLLPCQPAAPQVLVPAGRVVQVDFDCPTAGGTAIQGVVTGQRDIAIPGGGTERTFESIQVVDPQGVQTWIYTVDAAGNYTLPVVTPGTYTLELLAPAGPWGSLLRCLGNGQVQVTVPAGGGTVTAAPLVAACSRGGVWGRVDFTAPFQGGLIASVNLLVPTPSDPNHVEDVAQLPAGSGPFSYRLSTFAGISSGVSVIDAGGTSINCSPISPVFTPVAGQLVQLDLTCSPP